MATCFLNNIYCCYLLAHCSYGLQPIDNGVFNASKAAYQKVLRCTRSDGPKVKHASQSPCLDYYLSSLAS